MSMHVTQEHECEKGFQFSRTHVDGSIRAQRRSQANKLQAELDKSHSYGERPCDVVRIDSLCGLLEKEHSEVADIVEFFEDSFFEER